MIRSIFVLLSVSLAACTSAPPCDGGEAAGAYCAYSGPIVIEGGFRCPEHVPNRFDFGDVTFCGPPGTTLEQAMAACIAAGFGCGRSLCEIQPEHPDCAPNPDSCDPPHRGGYLTEELARASCTGDCQVCPEQVAGDTVVSWLVIEAEGCTCPATTEAPPLSCLEASLEVWRVSALLFTDSAVCTSDDECVDVNIDISCEEENNYFGNCPVTVHRDSVEELEEANELVAELMCPRTSDCMSGPACTPVARRCVAFQCQHIAPDRCVEDCEALGCSDCAARCIVEPECVAAATTCADVEACTPEPSRLVFARRYDEDADCLAAPSVVAISFAPATVSGSASCGIGPDGRPYVFASSSLRDAVGWPACGPVVSAAATRAGDC